MSAGLHLDRVGQIAVHDLERAVAFDRDTLGMRFLFQFPGIAFFDLGDPSVPAFVARDRT